MRNINATTTFPGTNRCTCPVEATALHHMLSVPITSKHSIAQTLFVIALAIRCNGCRRCSLGYFENDNGTPTPEISGYKRTLELE